MVLLGGGMGALLRYVLATAIMQRVGGKFPLGTFVINVSGSFLIGAVMTLLTDVAVVLGVLAATRR
jgi:CrcB protein